MSRSLLEDAFAHHVWATIRLVDACLPLSPEQLGTAVPGTYGSILQTVRHLVGSDSWYLFDITGDRTRRIDEGRMDLAELRAAMEGDGAAWSAFLAKDLDPDAVLKEIDEDDGFERDATIGIRLAQALHHGTDHCSQICTALTTRCGTTRHRRLELRPPGRPRRRGLTHVLTRVRAPSSAAASACLYRRRREPPARLATSPVDEEGEIHGSGSIVRGGERGSADAPANPRRDAE